MSTIVFVPGQRWISNTESELGLGIVVEIANRRVEISFPAAGEQRTYAMENAPISRVQYEVGQQVMTESEQAVTIVDVIDNNGCFIYNATDENGEQVIVPELDLSSFVQFSKPQDRLFAGQIDKNRAFRLRCETLEQIRHQQLSSVRGLLGARVQLLPHQLYIASEAANRYAPRVLLADEVGLGKTIEAGLIIHQQLITGRSKRVLVVVPDSLLHQWLVEMLRRFNLFFTILDEQRCQGLEEFGDLSEEFDDPFMMDDHADNNFNPFDSAQLVLCTLSFLRDNPARHAQAMAAEWDLLVVDEAHHLEWSEQQVSPAYSTIEALAKQARGLLLLTATPEQLGVASHFARLRLLDPDRYYDLPTFIEEEKNHQPVNALVQELLAEDAQQRMQNNANLLAQLTDYLGQDTVAELATAINSDDGAGFTLAVEAVISQLLDRHGTGRVLFRNTRSSVAGFPERCLQHYPLVSPARYVAACSSADANAVTIEQQLAPEFILGPNWIVEDPRVEWLSDWLKQHRSEKVLVICAKADTALDLEEHLRLRGGVHSAVFHEGLSLVARDRAAAYFADDEEGAQVLICSEIGSEGRNFQFSHHLVLFDLPLNPDLLEQRIGRLDRIGQRHTVELHVPYYQDSAQQVLLRWYHEGINAFERTCPAGLALYQEFEQSLLQCLTQQEQSAELEQLIENTKARTAETLQALQQGRDRLLELNSCNHEQADAIVEAMVEEERRQELTGYMEKVFDQFGVDQEHHSAAAVILRPGDHMINHTFPGLTDDAVTATYSREVALSREDMQFLSWEHPMVTGAMDMVLSGDFGNTAFCTLKLPPLKAGTVILEAIFIVQCTAPGELQLQRHLPLTPVRIVVDSNNSNLSNVLTTAHLEKLGQKVAKRSAQDLVRHARPQISTMVNTAEQLAEQQKDNILTSAAEAMQSEQTAELQRLTALAKVNPNIRQQELDYLKAVNVKAQRYLQGAQLKLDAVRIALVI
ncbi:RNA polymerase-associated protein RapA [Oceanicoccus sp. KOV_DT_Chl]|uniref:RNA polymerase-associated protein RapA n=1 Tax=Oceanicoccus sp. KOV_DT_Chl TaxID=1904639 RepID=UPI000C7D9488|nr:RNA polymerase-associated protein RapA [Oceanicoccus sp. KOV_DT_Chl]